MKELNIDPEFQRFIPPLTTQEFELLEQSITREGCRNAIVTWYGVILDGHNRYAVCQKHNIPFSVKEMYFESRDEAISWICANQLGRRNITEETRRYLIGKRYDAEKRIGARNISGRNQYSPPKLSPNTLGKALYLDTKHGIASDIGQEYRISHATVDKYGRYARAIDRIGSVDPALIPHIMSGAIHIGQENVIDISRLSDQQIRTITDAIPRNTDFDLSREFILDILKKAQTSESVALPAPVREVKTVKDMPAYDPDAAISSLALTIPSWRSSIERARNGSDMEQVSEKAKEYLRRELTSLRTTIENMITIVQEG